MDPAKQRSEQKIGAAVALMMAVRRAMTAGDGKADVMELWIALRISIWRSSRHAPP